MTVVTTTTEGQIAPAGKLRRGFACMDPAMVSRIASLGGKAAHAMGKAHKWTQAEAQAAGRKGGAAKHAKSVQASDTGTGQDGTAANTAAPDVTPTI